MADEFVRKEHFDEHVLRMDERFLSLEKRMEEGFSELRADMRQMRNWLVWLFGLVVFGFIGSIVLILSRDLILK